MLLPPLYTCLPFNLMVPFMCCLIPVDHLNMWMDFFSPIQVIRLFEIVQVVEYILIKGFCFGYKEPTLHLFSSRRCKLYIIGNILYKNQRRHLLCRVFTTQSSQNRPTLRLTARDGSPLGTPNA